jgi:hypothetical protein
MTETDKTTWKDIYIKGKLNIKTKKDKIITEWVNEMVHRYRNRRRKRTEEARKKGVNFLKFKFVDTVQSS